MEIVETPGSPVPTNDSNSESAPSSRPAPICGVLGILAPIFQIGLFGFFLFLVMSSLSADGDSWVNRIEKSIYARAFYIAVYCPPVCGFLLGLYGIIRNERRKYLAIIAVCIHTTIGLFLLVMYFGYRGW